MCDFGCTHFFVSRGVRPLGKYIYNKETGKLHIKGYCRYTKYTFTHYEEFDTEAEALAFDGRAVSMCKECERKREIKTNK